MRFRLRGLNFDFFPSNLHLAVMDAFYAPVKYISEKTVRLEGEEHHHLVHVMRKKIGEEIFTADGEGAMYRVRIALLHRDHAVCEIIERLPGYNELDSGVILIQALLKNPNKMDWIIEKATELGVSRIFPVTTERTLTGKDKHDRWEALALAAMKQSMRCRLPNIEHVEPFEKVISAMPKSSLFLFHEAAGYSQTISSEFHGHREENPIAVAIGPEGGFSEEEIALAIRHGAKILTLGKTRLRSETAAITAIARVTGVLKQS